MEWEKVSNQEVTMLLQLDFEKAYDMVEWAFVRLMLEVFVFLELYCNMVVTLLRDAMAQVDVNGDLTKEFSLERSIKKDCPLAPTLFVIASNALHYILRVNNAMPRVKGISLPNQDGLLNI